MRGAPTLSFPVIDPSSPPSFALCPRTCQFMITVAQPPWLRAAIQCVHCAAAAVAAAAAAAVPCSLPAARVPAAPHGQHRWPLRLLLAALLAALLHRSPLGLHRCPELWARPPLHPSAAGHPARCPPAAWLTRHPGSGQPAALPRCWYLLRPAAARLLLPPPLAAGGAGKNEELQRWARALPQHPAPAAATAAMRPLPCAAACWTRTPSP